MQVRLAVALYKPDGAGSHSQSGARASVHRSHVLLIFIPPLRQRSMPDCSIDTIDPVQRGQVGTFADKVL